MRLLFRSIVALIVGALAVFFLFGSFLSFSGSEHQRSTDRRINEVFTHGARFVSEFSAVNGRLPLQSEFAAWASAQPEREPGTFSLRHLSYQLGAPPTELVQLAGVPSEATYYLEIWRGEWSEYYAPWAARSTIEPSDLKWYLETYFSMGVLFLVFASGLLFIAYRLMCSNISSSGRATSARRST